MSGIIVDKYVTAIIRAFNKDELSLVLENFETLFLAFKDRSFSEMINSPLIENSAKESFVLSLVKGDEKFNNLLKILSENSRLGLIPEIFKNLTSVISASKNEYKGVVYSKDKINKSQIKELENLLSKKFNSEISLEFVQSDYNGVKIDLEGLGADISFSLDRLKQGISQYVLKAI
ncbi:MAG: F0F1 ATP synthase subunit delta [Campylobacter sp.]|nr:F0F1 ATP synthase subunit delta [Campylobacter sp.]